MSMTETGYLVTSAEVHTLYPDMDANVSADPFIVTAHMLVYENLDGKGLSDTRLKQIEMYLAAHFSAVSHGVPSFEAAGRVQESRQYKVDLGLKNTMFGQQAIALDTTGTLRGIANGSKRVSMTWLGMTDDEKERLIDDGEDYP